jgi:hypothetical protein
LLPEMIGEERANEAAGASYNNFHLSTLNIYPDRSQV